MLQVSCASRLFSFTAKTMKESLSFNDLNTQDESHAWLGTVPMFEISSLASV